MRILITNTGPWGTGSGTVSDGIMKELKRRGHEVLSFFPDTGFKAEGNDKYYKNKKEYRIVPFPATYDGTLLYTFPLIIPDPNPRNYPDAWTYKMMSETELKAYMGYMKQALARVIKQFKPDVIECQHIWLIGYLLKELGCRYICVAHHSDQLGFLYDERMVPYALETAKGAEYLFAISDYVKDEVVELYGADPDKVIQVSNGYDQSIFYPFYSDKRKTLQAFGVDIPASMPVITFCGKVSATKGIDVLLEANKFIQQKTKAALLILGSGSLDTFPQEIRDRFHLENVYFLGHRTHEEIACLHNIARMSVLPSRMEGFGIAALEAMGCSTPIVATRTGGLADFAVGRVVEPENPVALAKGMLDILNMGAKEYFELKMKSYEAAMKYSWKNIVDKRMPYYEDLAWTPQETTVPRVGRVPTLSAGA